jgi:orotate phosphoribosyltransferase
VNASPATCELFTPCGAAPFLLGAAETAITAWKRRRFLHPPTIAPALRTLDEASERLPLAPPRANQKKMTSHDAALAQDFVRFAVGVGALRFGEFKTKAGRLSPYFFNAGLFDDGVKLGGLASFYARALLADGPAFDVLFGPAYKGIPLAAAIAIELARLGRNVPFAYNRKEAKDHGEGGVLVGAPLAGRVLIVDDVISAGTSVRESIALIEASGARPAGVAIALDRQERAGDSPESAVQHVRGTLGLPVVAVATLDDLLGVLGADADPALQPYAAPVRAYRERYGV